FRQESYRYMSIYLGVDIGTTAVKVLAMSAEGQVLALASREYQYQTPRPGWVEQDAEDWWRLVCEGVREVTAQVEGTVAALALSTQGDTVVPLDADGRALAPAITWMDTRSLPQVARLVSEEQLWHRITGASPAPFAAMSSLLWWREERPEVFEQAARFALVADLVIERLTGAAVCDAPNASRTMLYDIEKRRWAPELVERVGVSEERLPRVAESGTVVGTVRPEVAEELGLSPQTQAVLGGHDQTCAAVGCGVVAPGSLLLSCGTAWVALAATEGPVWDEQRALHAYCHAVPGGYVSLGAFAGGNLLRWFRDEFWRDSLTEGPDTIRPAVRNGSDHLSGERNPQSTAGRMVSGPSNDRTYDAITTEAAQAWSEGRPPLVFLPHFYGASGPVACPQARGAWLGLTLSHTRGDMALALLQGVARQAAWCVENLERQGGQVEQVRMIGGGARSRFWTQLVADAIQKPVALPAVREAAAFGAALIAATAAGEFRSLQEAAGTVEIVGEVRPEREADPAAGERVRKLMMGLKGTWEELAGM
ncbi:MAG TPA: FGGY family carbohydrate kinase, partial [Tepidisphaeraceae bacterium]|nr:FGGY family carbohydrate kinase [Tepidisphaeraceae bacterium]